jgi:hypothetical protein
VHAGKEEEQEEDLPSLAVWFLTPFVILLTEYPYGNRQTMLITFL